MDVKSTASPRDSVMHIVRAFPMTWWTICSNILLAGSLGLTYIFSNQYRFFAPAFDPAKSLFDFQPHLAPMRVWGILFLGLAVGQAITMRISLKWLARFSRATGVVCVFYGLLYLSAAQSSIFASYGGFIIYFYLGVIHFAAASTVLWLNEVRR